MSPGVREHTYSLYRACAHNAPKQPGYGANRLQRACIQRLAPIHHGGAGRSSGARAIVCKCLAGSVRRIGAISCPGWNNRHVPTTGPGSAAACWAARSRAAVHALDGRSEPAAAADGSAANCAPTASHCPAAGCGQRLDAGRNAGQHPRHRRVCREGRQDLRGRRAAIRNQGDQRLPRSGEAATLLATLPGLNAVRLAATPGTDPGTIDALVQGLTSHGVVVEIEDHSSAGAAFAPNGNNVLTGSALDAETAWYAGLAARYRNNPHVWFGTANEPDAPSDPGSIAQQEIAIYNAIRGAGNKTMVMLSERGGFTTDFAQPYAADYAKMSNVAWDSHYYGWVSNYSTKQADIFTSFSNQIANAQSIRSADGLVPVVIGEYGTSTTGSGQDANGTQVVQMVGDSKIGGMAWAWNAGTDALTSGSNTLTPFGQQVLNSFSTK